MDAHPLKLPVLFSIPVLIIVFMTTMFCADWNIYVLESGNTWIKDQVFFRWRLVLSGLAGLSAAGSTLLLQFVALRLFFGQTPTNRPAAGAAQTPII
ncbi:MAG TPA: hypothetical protein VFF65_10280 [Phycisphaerales bacterium]|nr:hypothetical protein [Phycisphaerales bacterium]